MGGTDIKPGPMKKIPLFTLFLSLFFSPVSSQDGKQPSFEKKIGLKEFNRLIVRSNITVMLIENDAEDSARISGDEKFIEKVMLLQNGDELIVRTKSLKDLKRKGIIYIPVHHLQNLEINADAKVISYNTLQSPVLNVLINGACTVDLALKGRLNIREAEGYGFTYRRVYENKNTPIVQKNTYND